MPGVTYTLRDVAGVDWSFRNVATVSATHPLRLAEPPTGLTGPAPKHDDDQNVDQAGVTWRAAMYDPNVIGLKLRFGPIPKGDTAIGRFMDFVDGLGDGRRVGRFTVAGPRRTTFQEWRLVGDPPAVPTNMLLHTGTVVDLTVALRSDESWWRTAPVDVDFLAADFPTAEVDNDSDEDVWPYFELTGPITLPTLGVAGEAVSLPTIGSGQTWKIDTDPNHFRITDHLGVDRTFWGGSGLPGRWYVKAPARTAGIPVTITGTGTSGATKLKVVLPQLYRSAI